MGDLWLHKRGKKMLPLHFTIKALSFPVLSTTYIPRLEIKVDPTSTHVAQQSHVQLYR